ncbi:type IV secretory system conjugative DNA transfer family protein [Ottowia sp.]|uniref:type IV secretory system conjugative DNA transfer family protein n=1 Tax=Ottowia sp. TaxID=1898956 RepID=UPI003A870F13
MNFLKLTLLSVALLMALALGAYLSGLLLFWRINLPLDQAGLFSYGQYALAYHAHPLVGTVIRTSGLIGFGFPVLLVVGVAVALWWHRPSNLYGAARFAGLGDLRQRQMLDAQDTAIVVGRKDGRYIYFNGQQFALLAAPTRSGKGVGVVIPNLLSYKGSVVVLDIKQENFDLTSGFRARHGQEVYLFNPFAEDLRTHRWNPLSYVSSDPNFRISDVQSIAAMLYPVSNMVKDPFWANQAQNAFVAFALYAFELADHLSKGFPGTAAQIPTIGRLYRLASGAKAGQSLREYLESLAAWPYLSPSAKAAFATLTGQANETFASIMGTFKEPLNPWLNPVVDAATSGNDFDLRDVRRKKMSIYVAIQPNKLAESRLILNLFFSQLINQNTRELPQANPELKHQCLLLMDEFTSIGRVDIIANAVSFMAGYNLRLLPIIQSLSQLEATYGQEQARTIITNHALQIVFAPREQRDANEYSEMLGYTSITKDSVSRSRSRESSYTRSQSEERRALMLPQELKAMGDDKEILLVEGMAHPVMADKIRYYKEPAFKKRLLPKVEVLRLDLEAHAAEVKMQKVRSSGQRLEGHPSEARADPAHPRATTASAAERVAATLDASQAAVMVQDQEARHSAVKPQLPREYTGLTSISAEFESVMSQLERSDGTHSPMA